MNLLLDTHTFVWWRDDPAKLSIDAFEALSTLENDVFISTVVVWEIQIKLALDKIKLKWPLKDSIEVERKANGFRVLPVSLEHSLYIDKLPMVHKDPFDRMLIAQAMVEGLTIVSRDARFSDYEAKLLW
jgi:PIN domain nuclease of toxin-antitoxin system